MSIYFNQDIKKIFIGGTSVKAVYMGGDKVWPSGLPIGTVFEYGYTGAVQSVELPPGKYKLQCWGAQGGTSYGSSNGAGSKGGYSEGVLTLTETTMLYVFVGGQGSRGSSTSLVNGGWNGGGASVGYTYYSSGGTYGYSYPACGGGATDISTVTSSMIYSNGRTNRSAASLLARCIVAGGGAGGSFRYTQETTYDVSTSYSYPATSPGTLGFTIDEVTPVSRNYTRSITGKISVSAGVTYVLSVSSDYVLWFIYNDGVNDYMYDSFTQSKTFTPAASGVIRITCKLARNTDPRDETDAFAPGSEGLTIRIEVSTPSTTSSSGSSNKSQQGGGTSGKGQYPGTQSSAGGDGGFGFGENQTVTNYRYAGGGAGGGWYGGGTSYSDSTTSCVNYSGGGSGFVNTEANASYRPSGYTGLQLDSGETIAGNTSHPSTSGGTETGHSGNGYCKITVIE